MSDSREIWENQEWVKRRQLEQYLYAWYSGENIAKARANEVDPDTGEQIKLYPLSINPIAKMCRIHRSVLLGMSEDYTSFPIQIVLKSQDAQFMEEQQKFIRSTWYHSNGASLVSEGALLSQVHGGHVFKVNWEPNNALLPYRMRVVGIPSWQFFPVYAKGNYWDLDGAYIGYMIDGSDAEKTYGIKDDGHEVLYLEEWTRDSYRITVDGMVPEVEGYGRLEGKNDTGRVPIVYIPHYRDGDFYGPSLVDSLIGLCEELNGRSADFGEAVIEVTHQTMVGRNIDRTPKRLPIDFDNRSNPSKWAIDIGVAKNMPNSHEPNLDYPSTPQIPESVKDYVGMLWQEILRQSDVSSVLVGMDDTASGRITGPVTGMRSVNTIQHCHAERIEWSTAMIHLTDIMLRMAVAKKGAFGQLGVKAPAVTEADFDCQVICAWPTMVPVEVAEKVAAENSRLTAGGRSLESYLIALGEQDVEGEIERIQADREAKNQVELQKIEAQAKVREANKPPESKGGGNATKGSSGNNFGRK